MLTFATCASRSVSEEESASERRVSDATLTSMRERVQEVKQYQKKVSWYELSSREFSSRTENNTLIIAVRSKKGIVRTKV